MDYTEKLLNSLKQKVATRISKLKDEIKVSKEKQWEAEDLYGFGGSYIRREHAVEKREKEIERLEQFVNQIRLPIITTEMRYSVLYCNHCHSEILTQGNIYGEWHECPVCKKMILGNLYRKSIFLVAEENIY